MAEALPTPTSMRFGVRGIAGRLMMAFATIALCTILAAGAGLWSLWSVGESLGDVTEYRLPTAITSLTLSRHVERVVSLAPRLISANSQEEREQARQQLAPAINDVQALLDRLYKQSADTTDVAAITRQIDDLRGHLQTLNTMLVRRDEIEQQRLKSRDTVLDLRDSVGRLLEAWSQILAKQLARLDSGDSASGSFSDLAIQIRALNRSQELLSTIAERAISVDTAGSELNIAALGFQADRAATSLINESGHIHPDLAKGVGDLLQANAWALRGEASIFAQSRLIWQSRQQAEVLLKRVAASSADLSAAVDGIVAYTEAQAVQTKVEALEIRKTALLTLVAAVTLSLLAVAGIGAGYVYGHLLTRLKSVTGTLHRLAEGKLDVQVNHTGDRDEIGEVARGLAVMRLWLQDRKRLDAEVHAMNRNLDKQVQARTAELQEASEAQSHMLAVLSHEIRSPLTGIIGVTDMLEETASPSRRQEYLAALREGAKALLSVVNSVLDHAKIQAGPQKTEIIEFGLVELVQGVAALQRPQAEAKGLQVETSIGLDVPRRVRGDEGRLRQVLVNLMTNAIKFTADGRVMLRVAKLPSERLRIEVEDTGIGVPEQARQTLFKAYSQAHASISRRFGGTGLGLAICRGLVEAMGGEIDYMPANGGGSLFWLELPLLLGETRTESRDAAPPPPSAPKASLRVLVVDDNPVNCMVVRTQVEKLGHVALCAANGQEALAVARQNRLDVALLDLHLPDMNGSDLARALRALPGLDSLPLVAATGETQEVEINRARAAGMALTIIKPFSVSILADILSAAVTNSSIGPTPQTNPCAPNGLAAIAHEFGSTWAVGFVETMRAQLIDLANRLSQLTPFDIEGHRHVAHALRPSATMLADTRLLMACETLSAACRNQDTARIRDQADELIPLLRKIADELAVSAMQQVA